jgi:gamma-glutamylcyclotransferase (GGCT)/AIG2-like uncharacterized protein YtfP
MSTNENLQHGARRAGALYFAYGSNLDPEQMRLRCPDAQPAGPAVLRGHTLRFTGWSAQRAGGGVATIVRDRRRCVRGALWQLSAGDLERLDRFEGIAAGAYERRRVMVTGVDGQRRRAHTYVRDDDWPRPPSWGYLGLIYRAYQRLGFDVAPLFGAARESKDLASERTAVFVYGSLRAGEINHALLESIRPLRLARTEPCFDLVSLGPYPALVRGGETAVVGEVYEVDAETLAELDRLEAHPDFYRREPVRLEDGEEVLAYLLEPEQVEGAARIECGDWTAWRRSMSEPLQMEMWP